MTSRLSTLAGLAVLAAGFGAAGAMAQTNPAPQPNPSTPAASSTTPGTHMGTTGTMGSATTRGISRAPIGTTSGAATAPGSMTTGSTGAKTGSMTASGNTGSKSMTARNESGHHMTSSSRYHHPSMARGGNDNSQDEAVDRLNEQSLADAQKGVNFSGQAFPGGNTSGGMQRNAMPKTGGGRS